MNFIENSLPSWRWDNHATSPHDTAIVEAKLSVSLLVGFEFCVGVVFPARSKHMANSREDRILLCPGCKGFQHADSQDVLSRGRYFSTEHILGGGDD